MFITKDFVMLNWPKTGSTFSRNVLKSIHSNRFPGLLTKQLNIHNLDQGGYVELLLPNIRRNTKKNQHGAFSQIPELHKKKDVFTVIRNPFSRFLSLYEYRSWNRKPFYSIDFLKERFPKYPELSIDEFTELCLLNEKGYNLSIKENVLGIQTIQFIFMFFKDPQNIFSKIDYKYLQNKDYLNDLESINFLQQEDLRNQLINFLSNYDYTDDELAFINNAEKTKVTTPGSVSRDLLWTNKSFEYVFNREKMLFEIFKNYGIEYESPNILN